MAALKWVHVPGFSALILRKDSARLRLAGGLIPRSKEWLYKTPDYVSWKDQDRMWIFNTNTTKPATIQFGYLDTKDDKYRYGSSEYQIIIWDELTEFPEEDYLFLFSRLRMTEDIRQCGVTYQMLSGSNPGGRYHDWVKARFITDQAEQDLKLNNLKDVYYKEKPKLLTKYEDKITAFVPAKVKDNPAVNEEEYTANLMHLPPVTRERLLNGDWTILPTGLVKPEYLRYYKFRGNSFIVELLKTIVKDDGSIIHTDEIIHEFDLRQCRRIITIDTAGGVKEIEAAAKGKQYSYTAMGCFDYKRWSEGGQQRQAVLIRDVRRGKGWTYPEIKSQVLDFCETWKHFPTLQRVRVEDKALGIPLATELKSKIPIDTISTQGLDKVQRSVKMQLMFEQGCIYLPKFNNTWVAPYESEMLSIQGYEKEETNDQWDVTAYAAIELQGPFNQTIVMQHDPRKVEPLTPGLGDLYGNTKGRIF